MGGGCNHLPSLVHPHAVEDIRLRPGGSPSGVPVATARTSLEVTLAEGRFTKHSEPASLGLLFKETDVYWRRKVNNKKKIWSACEHVGSGDLLTERPPGRRKTCFVFFFPSSWLLVGTPLNDCEQKKTKKGCPPPRLYEEPTQKANYVAFDCRGTESDGEQSRGGTAAGEGLN